uniref:Reverse transcriptase domain-containing protein n=1 Tax=Tanacetum cinerariifolium TaxID=118510 RepID=A0A6L2P6W5_TANCI|nr:hypothetical protein [Tanacetum cinerariifolium]
MKQIEAMATIARFRIGVLILPSSLPPTIVVTFVSISPPPPPVSGFPAQSVGSSNTDVLDSPCLLVLITETSQSRQHVITSLIHIESCKSPTKILFDVGSSRISIFTAQEEEIGRLKERVQVLEDREVVATKQSGEDAPIKGRSNNEGEAAAERISNDSEEIARFLTSMDAATVLAGETNVLTGSGFIPTVGPPTTVISIGSEVGPTASPIVTRRNGKEVMVESDTPKKKKLQEQIDAQVARELEEQQEREDMRINVQIARDAEVARIHAEEEIQGMIDSLDK